MRPSSLVLLVLLAGLGCRPAPTPEAPVRGLAIPVRDPTPRPPDDDDPRESPPESEPARPAALPVVARERLPVGAELLTVAQKGSPLVELRVAVRGAGGGDDEAAAGLARLALRVAVEGGTLRQPGRVLAEQPGGPPERAVAGDAAVLSMTVAAERAVDTLGALVAVLREPRLDGADFARLRRLEAGQARAAEPAVAALLQRELRRAPASPPDALDRLRIEDIRAFARQRYAPGSLVVAAVGDVDAGALRGALERATAAWKPAPGAPPAAGAPPASAPPAAPAEGARVWVLDTPTTGAVELFVAAAGPGRGGGGDEWAATRLLAQVLGGAPTARLGAALAGGSGATGARVELVGSGAGSRLVGQSTAEVTRAAAALATMVEVLGRPVEGLTEAELAGARRRALASFWRSLAAPSSLADELVGLGVQRAPDDALRRQLDALQSADAAAVQKAAQRSPLVAVAVGDAARVAPLLTRWGEVTVVDPVTLERRRVVSP